MLTPCKENGNQNKLQFDASFSADIKSMSYLVFYIVAHVGKYVLLKTNIRYTWLAWWILGTPKIHSQLFKKLRWQVYLHRRARSTAVVHIYNIQELKLPHVPRCYRSGNINLVSWEVYSTAKTSLVVLTFTKGRRWMDSSESGDAINCIPKQLSANDELWFNWNKAVVSSSDRNSQVLQGKNKNIFRVIFVS